MIGNSHMGPVAQASARRMRESDHLQIEHYIDRTYGETPLRLVSGSESVTMPSFLLEKRPGVSSVVNVDAWDRFVVVGLGFSLIRLVEEWATFQPDALPPIVGEHLLTPDLVDGYNNSVMDSTKAMKLITSLRSMSSKPIAFVPAPLPAEWVRSRSGPRFERFRTFIQENNRAYLIDKFENQADRIRAMGVDVVAPPPEAVTDEIWTRSSFCLGQPTDTSAESFYTRGDFYHMNREYGELVSSIIFRDLSDI